MLHVGNEAHGFPNLNAIMPASLQESILHGHQMFRGKEERCGLLEAAGLRTPYPFTALIWNGVLGRGCDKEKSVKKSTFSLNVVQAFSE